MYSTFKLANGTIVFQTNDWTDQVHFGTTMSSPVPIPGSATNLLKVVGCQRHKSTGYYTYTVEPA